METLRFEALRMGQVVRLSQHKDATQWLIKRIDSESESVWLVGFDGTICGWVSGCCIYKSS